MTQQQLELILRGARAMTQQQIEQILSEPVYPMNRDLGEMNWRSAWRYGERRAARSWRAGFLFGVLLTAAIVAAGLVMTR